MSNRNLQKHLPQGLDEHNFQDGWKVVTRLHAVELGTWFQSVAEIEIYTGIHFCMSSCKLCYFCVLFRRASLESLNYSGVLYFYLRGRVSKGQHSNLWPLFSLEPFGFWSTPTLQMNDLEIPSALKSRYKAHSHLAGLCYWSPLNE